MSTTDGHITISGPDADLDIFVCRPEQGDRLPVVIVYMDVFGPRDELFEICRRFARHGFAALLPNLFSRLGSPVFPPVNARGAVMDPACVAANDATTMDMTLADTVAIVTAARNGAFEFAPAGFYAVGYCMGGRHSLAAVAGCDDVEAGISAHGGRLVDETSSSPHLLVAGLKKPFHFYHATDDRTCPDTHQDMIAREAEQAGPHVISERLGAHHGWSFPQRWAYDAAVSDRVFERAITLFGRGAG